MTPVPAGTDRPVARPGRDEVLRAGVERTKREGGVLFWIDLDDLETLLDDVARLTQERDTLRLQVEWDGERLHALSPAVGMARLYLDEGKPEIAKARLDEAVKSLDGRQEHFLERYAAAVSSSPATTETSER